MVNLDVKYVATSGTCWRMVMNASRGSDGVKGSRPKVAKHGKHD